MIKDVFTNIDMQNKIDKLLSEHFGIQISNIYGSLNIINDLHGDSLDIVELEMSIEETFNISYFKFPDGFSFYIHDIYDLLGETLQIEISNKQKTPSLLDFTFCNELKSHLKKSGEMTLKYSDFQDISTINEFLSRLN
jgi:acyl carrier protein